MDCRIQIRKRLKLLNLSLLLLGASRTAAQWKRQLSRRVLPLPNQNFSLLLLAYRYYNTEKLPTNADCITLTP